MSKIHDALKKFQDSAKTQRNVRSSNDSGSDTTVIARLVERSKGNVSAISRNKMLHFDQEALRDAGLIAPEDHAELLASQYRDIKRPLIAHAFGKRATRIESGELIMVTSAISGEGKTFTSMNLALSMSQERDHTVLLMDADVAKPHISQMFGAEDEIGLLDLLENPDHKLHDVILPTDAHGLSVLPAGKPRPNAAELLASDAMEVIVSQLSGSTSRQIVILDSPPLLQTNEAKVLARLAGQIVMVVRAGKTSRDLVVAALSTIDDEQAINFVLNQVQYTSSKYQHSYGYGAAMPEKKEAADNEIFS